MEANKLRTLLKSINPKYDFNTSELLSLEEISAIYSLTDEFIYPSSTTRFRFAYGSGVELLEIYNGYEDKDGNFISYSKLPQAYIEIAAIAGLTMASQYHPKEPFSVTRSL